MGALTSPPLKSGLAAVKKSNEPSRAVKWVQKIKCNVSGAGAGGRRSGNGAVSGTPVNDAGP